MCVCVCAYVYVYTFTYMMLEFVCCIRIRMLEFVCWRQREIRLEDGETCQRMRASASAVLPAALRRSTSACSATRSCTRGALPVSHAWCSAVKPSASEALTSAPRSRYNCRSEVSGHRSLYFDRCICNGRSEATWGQGPIACSPDRFTSAVAKATVEVK